MITSVTAPIATFDRRAGRETDLLFTQLRDVTNGVGRKIVTVTTPGDGLPYVMWTSGIIPQNTVWDFTVKARSCLADRSDSGRFLLDRSFVRAAGVASQTRASDIIQPIGAETLTVTINASNQIVVTATDAGAATEFTAWLECR